MSTLEAQLLKSINTASTANDIIIFAPAISSGGDVYVTGEFTGTLDIGGGVTPITTNNGAFLAKYTSTLTPTLLQYIGGADADDFSRGSSIAVSSSGDVYVTGIFAGTLSIGGGVTPITTISTYSAFVAKYTSTLTPTILKYIGGTDMNDYSFGKSVAVSPSGDVYVTGGFRGTLSIGDGVTPITTISTYSAFVAKYTSTLTPTLLKYIGGTTADELASGSSIAVSSSGDVYVTGIFAGTLSIGGGVTPITTISIKGSAFIARYTSTLTPTLLNYIGGTATTDYSIENSVAISSSGDVYVTGDFTGTLSIGGGVTPITTISINGSAFVARYTSTLTPTLLKYIGGTVAADGASGFSVAVSPSGDVYVTGDYTGTLSIGGGVPSITYSGGTFVADYTNTLTPTLLKYIGGDTSANRGARQGFVAVSSSGDVYVTGLFAGTISIGGGVPSITYSGTGENFFLAKYLTMLPTTTIPPTTSTTTHNEPICLVSGTPILTDQGIVAIENIDTAIHTIGNQRIVAVTKAITPEKNLICFEPHSVAINCPTKRTIMTPGHEVLYKGKLVQAKHFVGTINGVHTVPYDGKVVYNVLLQQHGVMSVNNMVVETLHPENKVAKRILNDL
jgi:hypothetical protein